MVETLLTPSSIMLYGRLMKDLQLDPNFTLKEGTSRNEFLWHQLKLEPKKTQPKLARIYGFSYEGHYYDLSRPAIFVVHGDGVKAQPTANENNGPVPPGTVDQSGVAAKGWDFMDDIRLWEYDRGDFSLRLDVESGTLEDILLEIELEEGLDESFYSGSRASVSGSRARVSGSRVSGSRVSGSRVSGSRARTRDRGD